MEADWSEFEAGKGLALPRDYKEFVSSYGPCEIYSDLCVSHPRGAVLNLGGLIDRVIFECDSLRRGFPEDYPYPIFPEGGGIVPVAETSTGTQVNLLPPHGAWSDWTVVVNWQGWWSHHPFGFTEFLFRALSGDSSISLFEEDVALSGKPPCVLYLDQQPIQVPAGAPLEGRAGSVDEVVAEGLLTQVVAQYGLLVAAERRAGTDPQLLEELFALQQVCVRDRARLAEADAAEVTRLAVLYAARLKELQDLQGRAGQV
ncbi:SMI1/KNR4 family protein [Streptomyces marianii]|uniref:SMI1/KNR4 family protein n=1 Tax=Streptomyces marianii TaxID=1817406 RepID=A0A5R9E5A5_9ACTN|nr:SMI1/KNR4 family protein [Streptomyces marianii]TLQ45180.1 SMI1/KNR4 family protein [Streptomyces marianii]